MTARSTTSFEDVVAAGASLAGEDGDEAYDASGDLRGVAETALMGFATAVRSDHLVDLD